MNVILYSTHCPKCRMIEKKLDQKKITYTVIDDVEEMKRLNFHSLPVLKLDDKVLTFKEAYKWVMEI